MIGLWRFGCVVERGKVTIGTVVGFLFGMGNFNWGWVGLIGAGSGFMWERVKISWGINK